MTIVDLDFVFKQKPAYGCRLSVVGSKKCIGDRRKAQSLPAIFETSIPALASRCRGMRYRPSAATRILKQGVCSASHSWPYKVSDVPYGIWPRRSAKGSAAKRREKHRYRMGLVLRALARQDRGSRHRMRVGTEGVYHFIPTVREAF